MHNGISGQIRLPAENDPAIYLDPGMSVDQCVGFGHADTDSRVLSVMPQNRPRSKGLGQACRPGHVTLASADRTRHFPYEGIVRKSLCRAIRYFFRDPFTGEPVGQRQVTKPKEPEPEECPHYKPASVHG